LAHQRLLALFLFPDFHPQSGLKYKITRGQAPQKGKCVMIKMFVTGALISKGFNGAEALRFSESAENPFVRFRVGVRVYDKRAENSHRFVNLSVKAFSFLVGRIRDMKLDAGMYVNIIGRYDDEPWEDPATHEKKNTPVLIADEIEFCYGGGNGKQTGDANSVPNGAGGMPTYTGKQEQPAYAGKQEPQAYMANRRQMPENFTGFAGFGDVNPYFPG
jgi:hypothetical protein